MRITFVSPVGEVGGAERVMLGLAGQLRDQHQTSAILMAPGPLREQLNQAGVATYVVELPELLQRAGDQIATLGDKLNAAVTAPLIYARFLEYVRKLRVAIAASKPDIVHSHGIKAHLASASAKPDGVKLVWHMQDYLSNRKLSRRLMRAFSSNADLVVAITRSVAEDVSATLPGRPVIVIPNFTDTTKFCPDPEHVFPLDAAAGLPEAAPGVVRVGLVATYAVWKGHHLFLDALARVMKKLGHNRVRAYIIGGPIYRTGGQSQVTESELRARIDELQLRHCVGLVPFQSDTAPIYRALDIFVHASIRPEPFGLTIVEAMACERAVVVAKAGGAAEIVNHDREGLYYEPGDAESLANAVLRLAGDAELRHRFGQAARKAVEKKYQVGTAAAAISAAYGAICPG